MSAGHQQLFRNATLTVAQVVLSATFLFAVYKYLLGAIGPEQMGVWSIVMALSTVARITDLGFAGGMTRFVAKYQALDDHEAVLEVVETGTLSLAVLSVLILTISYPLLRLGLPHVMTPTSAALALKLLPFALASFGALAVAGAYLSTLDGLQRADLRNLILMGGTLLYGVLIPLCVWRLGFEGLGWAQLGQSLTILVVAGWMVRVKLRLALVPHRWTTSRFKEMLGYNVHLQLTTFASLLGDPLTKLLLSHFGSLPMVTYYEMALKMVSQFRAIVVNVNQVLVPSIARAQEKNIEELRDIFKKTLSSVFLISLFFYGIAITSLPLASDIWIGHYNSTFTYSAIILIAAMQINSFIVPIFFTNLGTGKAKENSLSQLSIGFSNIILGFLLGIALGGWGVILSYGLSIAIGSVILLALFVRQGNFDSHIIIPPNPGRLISAIASSIGIFLIIDSQWRESHRMHILGMFFGCIIISLILKDSISKNSAFKAIRDRLKKDKTK